MDRRREQLRRRYLVVTICCLLGAMLGAYHQRQVSRGRSDALITVTRAIIGIPASAISHFSVWMGRKTSWIFHGYRIAAENRKLKEEVASLQQTNAGLREAEIDYERLRLDLGYVQSKHIAPLSADVVALMPDPNFDTMVIARGANDGVHQDSVVVTRIGLVGHVYDLTAHTSSVLLLTDQNSGAGARVQRPDSRTVGICKGNNSQMLSMVYMPGDANIRAGDVIVTSGLGGVYPAGIPIGTVKRVSSDVGSTGRSADILPFQDYDKLEEVYVLR